MTASVCPYDESDLLPLTLGETIAPDIQAHIDSGCPTCRQRLQFLHSELTTLRRAAQAFQDTNRTDATPGPQPTRPAPGTVGKYFIVGVLGKGAQGVVYRALHPELSRELVIKLSTEPLEEGEADRNLLVREGQLLADLKHPHLAQVYDLDFHENCPFLVMEYVRGVNLDQSAAQDRPTPRRAAALVAQLARALGVAHQRGLVHQDVKPANILIDEAGQPRLIDFGLVRRRDAYSAGAPQPDGGTAAYMAPEQARGETDRVDPRSDIFALGGVLYSLLTGRPPFTGRTWLEALARAERCDFDRNALRAAGVPRRLEAICLKALAADPADRYARAEDLAAALEAFVRRPRVIVRCALATAALALLAVGGWWVFHDRNGTPAGMADDKPTSAGPQYLVSLVQRDGNVFPDLKSALPLLTGDRFRVRFDLPRASYATLFWFSEGQLSELKDVTLTPGGDRDRLVFPRKGSAKLEGQAGTELLLVCASRAEKPRPEDIAPLLDKGGPLPRLPAQVLVLLDRDRVTTEVAGRGQVRAADDELSDVQDRLERLRQGLKGRCEFFAGVAFLHQGRQPAGKRSSQD